MTTITVNDKTLEAVLEAIQGRLAQLSEDFKSLEYKVDDAPSFKDLESRVEDVESKASTLEDNLSDLESRIDDLPDTDRLESRVDDLESRVDDLESGDLASRLSTVEKEQRRLRSAIKSFVEGDGQND